MNSNGYDYEFKYVNINANKNGRKMNKILIQKRKLEQEDECKRKSMHNLNV